MINIEQYKQFMKIDSFPAFTLGSFTLDISGNSFSVAKAEYSFIPPKHKLLLPANYDIPKFMLFHELTHILDAERYSNGEKSHDYWLTGYMEYHASQVELMEALGAQTIDDAITFSMLDHINGMQWTVQQYVNNKLETAKKMIVDSSPTMRIDGLNVFFNFLGLKSICVLFATDYSENYTYQEILTRMSTLQLSAIKSTMQGFSVDVEKTVMLYAQVERTIIT